MNDKRCQGKMGTLAWCVRRPTVERDGKQYCWQHDPVRRREKARKKWEEHKARIREIEAGFDAMIERKKRMQAAGLTAVSNEQLDLIISHGGISALLDKIAAK